MKCSPGTAPYLRRATAAWFAYEAVLADVVRLVEVARGAAARVRQRGHDRHLLGDRA